MSRDAKEHLKHLRLSKEFDPSIKVVEVLIMEAFDYGYNRCDQSLKSVIRDMELTIREKAAKITELEERIEALQYGENL